MRAFFTCLAGLAATFSLLEHSQAAEGNNCGIVTQDDSFFSVVGVQGAGIVPRQELREFAKDTETWNLFIQAFSRFQAMSQADKLSYFQVAGIHGAPFGEWDGVKGEGDWGYCPHRSNLFGTWHRPYLALFEQILHGHAVEITKEFPVGAARDGAQKAADKIRLPYWDWAIDPSNSTDGCMPETLRLPTTTVTFPNGTKADIPNPLYQFNFHPLKFEDFSALAEFQFKNWNTTIRYPANGYASNATSRNDEVSTRITAQQTNNRDILYKLLTVYQPFNEWSNKGNGGKIGNIETLHDGIHNSFGLGNMGIVEVSAFDPVFWFHHANIDRLIAIYQKRYPDTYVEDSTQSKATYAMAKNSTQGTASPLAPFHMNALGDMWTSTTSRNWESFGYTYPELANNPSNNTLTLNINRLYRPQYQGLNKNNTLTTLPPSTNTTVTPGQGNGTQTLNGTADAIDWMCEVNLPTDIKNKMTYSVRAFLGKPNDNPKLWATDPNYVGQVATLSSPRMDSNVTATANIVLTDKLAQKFQSGELKSLDRDTVAAYLEEYFYWRIQQIDSTEIPRDNAPRGLNVTVISVPVQLPQSELEVPRWIGNFSYYPEILGRPNVNGTNANATHVVSGGASATARVESSTLKAGLSDAALGTGVGGSVQLSTVVENGVTAVLTFTKLITVVETAGLPTSSAGSTGAVALSTVVENGVTRVVVLTEYATVVETVFATATAAA